jgi:hypothetical protein
MVRATGGIKGDLAQALLRRMSDRARGEEEAILFVLNR